MRYIIDSSEECPHPEEAAQRLSRRTHSADPAPRHFNFQHLGRQVCKMIGLQTAARNIGTDPAADFDAVIIGAGVSGLYQLCRLRQLGLRVRVFETGTGVGGTWYWNRYPGARLDSESWTYGYSFSQELLEEWDWEEHFAGQPETERYLNYVADKFGLRRDTQFKSRVTAAHYQEDARAAGTSSCRMAGVTPLAC